MPDEIRSYILSEMIAAGSLEYTMCLLTELYGRLSPNNSQNLNTQQSFLFLVSCFMENIIWGGFRKRTQMLKRAYKVNVPKDAVQDNILSEAPGRLTLVMTMLKYCLGDYIL